MTLLEFCRAYGVTPADVRWAAISTAFGYGKDQVPAALWAHWDGTTSRPTLMGSLLQSLGADPQMIYKWHTPTVKNFLWSILLPEEQALLVLAGLPL